MSDQTKVQFYLANKGAVEIWYDSKPTGFMARQEKEKTKVWSTKNAVVQTKDLILPHTRYSFASETPDCGHGVSRFVCDFLQAWDRLS